MNDLEIEVSQASEADEDQEALSQAMAIKIPAEKLKRLVQSHPPDASWYREGLNRP